MYSSGQEELYDKSAPPTAPPVHGGEYQYHQAPPPATGIPISSQAYVYTDTVPAPPPQFQATNHGSWSTGLFDCFSDVPNCCVTFWCPCITFGQIAEIADKGSSSCGVSGALYALIGYLTGCACFYSCFYRTRLRQQYNLHESPCDDCLVHFCCESCALCQEARELKHRGFDLSIGWHGNLEKQNGGGVTMAQFAQPGMDR